MAPPPEDLRTCLKEGPGMSPVSSRSALEAMPRHDVASATRCTVPGGRVVTAWSRNVLDGGGVSTGHRLPSPIVHDQLRLGRQRPYRFRDAVDRLRSRPGFERDNRRAPLPDDD